MKKCENPKCNQYTDNPRFCSNKCRTALWWMQNRGKYKALTPKPTKKAAHVCTYRFGICIECRNRARRLEWKQVRKWMTA